MENVAIREAAKSQGVKLWEIAERMGIAEGTFIRKLRRELPANQQADILAKIEAIAQEKKEAV